MTGEGRRTPPTGAPLATAPRAGITVDASVNDVMTVFPATIAVFLRHRMSCVGCLMGPFHSVADAAAEYDLEPGALLAELRQAAAASSPRRSGRARADP
jgi:hybrid cluster-associated redox disulfide protein